MNYECMFIFSQTVSMVHTLGTKKNLYKMYKYRYRGWDDQGVIWGRERERELEIKSCVGDRIWKWGITQCFFKRMRKYYMKTRVKKMHIGKLDKEFNTYYEKKEGTHVHWMMNLWEIYNDKTVSEETNFMFIYIFWWAFPFLLRWLTTSRSLHQINICHRV